MLPVRSQPERPTTLERTISVTGTGRVRVRPDLADLRLGVAITALTAGAARAASATAMTAVIAKLKELGIDARDIQTTDLSLSPVYDYSTSPKPPRLTGYALTNVVAVTIRDLERVGDSIDGALGAGATSLDSIAFTVEDPTTAETAAREAAVADARAKADTLASAAGVSIIGVAAISESGGAMPYPVHRGEIAMLAVKEASTPVEAGTNEVAVSVAVTYRID